MDFILYIMIFMMGTVFGSFFTLAVYRIPLKKDITHERSFCPNCNHRLEFLDLIPIISYMALKGKCRYCGEKIRIRYLILEVLSGLVFLFSYISLNIHFPYYDIQKLIYFASFVFMYVTIAIIIGIDKENKKIELGVIFFGTIMQILYIVYLYIFESKTNIYRYGIYFLFMIALIILEKILKKNNYIIEVLIFITYLNLCLNTVTTVFVLVISILFKILWKFINKIAKKENSWNFGTIIGIVSVVMAILRNYYIFFI